MQHSYESCPTLTFEVIDNIAVLKIDRPKKRNALDSATIEALGAFVRNSPGGVKAAVLASTGDHFSAGLDLSEAAGNEVFAGLLHSRNWHRHFDDLQYGTIPFVSVLNGAVIGGGLELALATHIRVAEPSAFFALPEGSRGIFVGGGASVRLPRVIGVHRMADMMLTGRVLSADEGYDLGIAQYRVEEGQGLARGIELAKRIAENATITNYSVLQALPRIAEMGPNEGLFVESLMATVSKSSEEAQTMLADFLEGRSKKVSRDNNVGG